jgi:hypothetical protein
MRGGLIGAIAAGGMTQPAAGQIGAISVVLLHKARTSPSTQRHTQEA